MVIQTIMNMYIIQINCILSQHHKSFYAIFTSVNELMDNAQRRYNSTLYAGYDGNLKTNDSHGSFKSFNHFMSVKGGELYQDISTLHERSNKYLFTSFGFMVCRFACNITHHWLPIEMKEKINSPFIKNMKMKYCLHV